MDEARDELFTALRRLELFRKDALSDVPSHRQLARIADVAPTTVGQWLLGTRFPQRVDGVLRIVEALRSRAAGLGIGSSAHATPLLNDQRWREMYEAEAAKRAQRSAAETEKAQGLRVLAAYDAQRIAGLPDPPRPLAQWTAKQLGVHAAVSGDRDFAVDEFNLPQYSSRAHDADLLRTLLDSKKNGKASLVIVRGGSCSGKTRTAYEGIKSVVPEWALMLSVMP